MTPAAKSPDLPNSIAAPTRMRQLRRRMWITCAVLGVCAFMAGIGVCRALDRSAASDLISAMEALGWAIAATLAVLLVLLGRRSTSVSERLSESERRFQLMADAAPAIIWTTMPAGGCDYCNRAWFEFMGRNTSGTLGEAWAAAIHPDDFEATRIAYLRAVGERRDYRWEFRLRRHDGAYRWVLSFGAPRMGPDGEYAGYVGMCVDITEQREARRMAEDALGRFDRAVTAADHGIWEMDLETARLYHSPRARELLGIQDEFIEDGWSWFEMGTHPEDRAAAKAIVERCVREGTPYRLEFRRRVGAGLGADDQEWQWFRGHGICTRDATGRPVRLTGSVTNITEERSLVQSLREAMARYEVLARLAPVGIFQTAPDGACLFVNDRWCQMAGLTPEQAQGHGWAGAVHPHDRQSTADHWYAAATSGGEFYHENRFQRPDGSVVWLISRAQALRDEHGQVTGHLGTCTDVTALKESEAKLLEVLRRQAAAADRENLLRRELDHRVRNNLASLLGMIRVSEESSMDRRAVIARLRAAVRTMNDSHMLISSAHGRPIRLDRLLDRLLRGPATRAGGRIVFNGPEVRVAPERVNALAMTLQELATNCLKHGALSVPDGSVDITWTVATPDDGRVRLIWCETGSPTVAEPVEGTGLSLLRSLVAIDLEGAAQFEFAPGGLTCTIDLQTHEKHLRKIALNGAAP